MAGGKHARRDEAPEATDLDAFISELLGEDSSSSSSSSSGTATSETATSGTITSEGTKPSPPPRQLALDSELFFPRTYHVWPLIVGAIVVFIVLTGSLTAFSRQLLASQADERAAVQQQGNVYLDESIALIQEADSVIVEMDKASESQITEADIPRLEALLDRRASTRDNLDEAIARARQAEEIFLEEERQELAQHAQSAATHRKQMLEASARLITYDIAAMNSALDLERGWSLIVEADTDMRAAAGVVAGGDASAVAISRDYNVGALDKLGSAREALVAATEALSEVDLGVLLNYLDAKVVSAEIALASDEAFLAGDYDLAYAKNDEFIAKDAEVVALAEQIPAEPLNLVVTAYEAATKQPREEYQTARSQAADADVYLRAYLGVDVQHRQETT
jgi:hypothetical protein